MFLPFSIKADEVDLAPNAGSAVLMEFETGEIIFKKNSHEKLHNLGLTLYICSTNITLIINL